MEDKKRKGEGRGAKGPAAAAKVGPGTEQPQGHTGLCVPAVQPYCPYNAASVTP